MKAVPRSPSELKETLARIFPSLPRDFGSSGESVLADAEPTYHSVLREFAYFFARDVNQYTDRQLRRFAELVARSIATPGELGEAFDTWRLESMRQSGVESRFGPFLSAAMKSGT